MTELEVVLRSSCRYFLYFHALLLHDALRGNTGQVIIDCESNPSNLLNYLG